MISPTNNGDAPNLFRWWRGWGCVGIKNKKEMVQMKITKQIWNAAAVLLTAGLLAVVLSSGALASAVEETEILEKSVKVQVPFIENQGQVENEVVRFYARTFGGTLFVEDGGVITYSLPAADGTGAVIREFLSDREGVKPVGIEPSPTKVSYTAVGVVRFTKPLAYQNIGGEKKTVEVAYVIYEGNTYGFEVGNYDKKRPLIIDPLLASTFIGGGIYDYSHSIAIDGTGNVYVTGITDSSDYPTTPGAYDESYNGGINVFVSKLDWELSKICACDADGNPKEQFAPGQKVYVCLMV